MEQRPFWIPAQPAAVEIGGEVFLEVMVAWHRMALAVLLALPRPERAVLRVDILDRYAERCADPGEGIDHEPDQCAIAQSGIGAPGQKFFCSPGMGAPCVRVANLSRKFEEADWRAPSGGDEEGRDRG